MYSKRGAFCGIKEIMGRLTVEDAVFFLLY